MAPPSLAGVALPACLVPARRAARVNLMVALHHESASIMHTLFHDLRFALRILRKNRVFAAVAVITLALGIGSAATVFSWVQGVLLNPLTGVKNAHELVTLETVAPSGEYIDSSYPDYQDFREQANLLTGLIAFQDRPLLFGFDQQAHWIWAELVSGNFFDVLGVQPRLGRFFSTDEQAEKPGAPPVAVISERFWKRQFNSDPVLVGKTIKLNQVDFTVIGVAPEAFAGTIVGLSYDVWVPIMMTPPLMGNSAFEGRSNRPYHIMGRLGPGVTRSEANSQILTIARRLADEHPGSNQGLSARVLPIWDAPYGAQSVLAPLLRILMGACGVVLLIVSANVANMLLAQATARQREITVRLAVGASRWQIFRQCMIESLLLSLFGAVGGVALAFWLVDALNFFVPDSPMPVLLQVPLNGKILLFACGVAVATSFIFGLAPALQTVRTNLQDALRESSRTASGGFHSRRLRNMLVSMEVALALVTLVASGLLIQSFQAARKLSPGFDPDNILLVGLHLSASRYDAQQGKLFLNRLQQNIASLPGVTEVSVAEDAPLGFDGGAWEDIQINGYLAQPSESMKIYRNLIAPGYFSLMRIPIMEGRDFRRSDDAGAPRVAIVNESFANRFFAGQSPVGRNMRAFGQDLSVVGVVKDIRQRNLRESALPYFFVPLEQHYRKDTGIAVHVRTADSVDTLLPVVQRTIREMDPGIAIFAATSLRDYIAASSFTHRMAATLLTVLGTLALALAAIGLYSVMAYTVAQQRHELGIRVALGAAKADILKLVMRHGLIMTVTGIAVGIAGSLLVTQALSTLLLGITATDPATYATVAGLLIVIAVVACYWPARRAAQTDPLVVLRDQ